jgi:hypothetical protein
MARHHPGTPKLVVEPRKFVWPSSLWGILVENQVDIGGYSGGLGLKQTQSFLDSSMEM